MTTLALKPACDMEGCGWRLGASDGGGGGCEG